MRLDFVVGMAVVKKEVRGSVVVVVKKLQSPPAHQSRNLSDTIRNSHVIERFIAIVVIKGVHLPIHVGNKQVHPAVLVVIRRIHAHPGAWPPLGAVTNVGLQAYFLELPVTAINKQKIRHRIIGNEQVHPPVVIDVAGHDTPSLAEGLRNPRFAAHVGKSTVAVVVKQPAWHRLINTRDTVVAVTRLTVAAELDRKSTRLNSSHEWISYAVFCLKKKKKKNK